MRKPVRGSSAYFPLLFFLLIFLGDKIFLFPPIHDVLSDWKGNDRFIYESKSILMDRMIDNAVRFGPNYQYDILLGTSRSMAIYRTSPQKAIPVPLYNFSAPGASPSWYFYEIEKLFNRAKDHPPRRIYIEIDAPMFSRRSNLIPTKYAYDTGFLFRHTRYFPGQAGWGFERWELELFLLNRWMAAVQTPPDPRTVYDNLQSISYYDPATRSLRSDRRWTVLKKMTSALIQTSLEHGGGMPDLYPLPGSDERISENFSSTSSKYIEGFQEMDGQKYFFSSLLDLIASHNIQIVIFWPAAHPMLRTAMDKRGLIRPYQTFVRGEMNRIRTSFPDLHIRFIDPENSAGFTCRSFADSHHLTGRCADRFMIRLAEIAESDDTGDVTGGDAIPEPFRISRSSRPSPAPEIADEG